VAGQALPEVPLWPGPGAEKDPRIIAIHEDGQCAVKKAIRFCFGSKAEVFEFIEANRNAHKMKEVIEFKDYFWFMLERIGGVVVPRSNMPAEGDYLVRGLTRTPGVLLVGK
jgi:hypothetical protein